MSSIFYGTRTILYGIDSLIIESKEARSADFFFPRTNVIISEPD